MAKKTETTAADSALHEATQKGHYGTKPSGDDMSGYTLREQIKKIKATKADKPT